MRSDQQADDEADLFAGQLVEDDDFVDAVQELGPEQALELAGDARLHVVVAQAHGVGLGEAQRGVLGDHAGADVARHDDDDVAEVDGAPLGVGQPAVFEDLQQDVEDVGVRLFDLVEQHDAVGLAAHDLGELAALFVADVAGRRADQARHGVLFHVLAHVELHEHVFVAEEELGQGAGELGLAHARRAQEDERAGRPLGVFEARARAADGLGDGAHGDVLADEALVELVFHAQQLLGFGFGELEHRDAGPHADDLGDFVFADAGPHAFVGGLPLLFELELLVRQLALLVAQVGGLLELLSLDGGLFFGAHRGDLFFELAVAGRRRHGADAHAAGRFVDQVDRLVGQVAVGDVAARQDGGGVQRVVGDADAMVRLVAVAQALEDLFGLLGVGLFDLDLLEAALEGGVALEVLAVLVERGGADGLQLAASQRRLEDGGRVDGAFGGAGPDQVVELVDEQDDVALLADLLHDLLEALFELAAVLGAGHQGREVERVDLLGLEQLGHLVAGDALGEAFDHGRLADARLADEHRVVLGAPREDLHDALDLGGAPDAGVELAFFGELGEVATELVEHLGVLLAFGTAGLAAPGRTRQRAHDLVADLFGLGVEVEQDTSRDTFVFADQAEKDVLGADVVVAERQAREGPARGPSWRAA